MGRANRRHHTERMKARYFRKERLRPYWRCDEAKAAGIYANHGCNCSCWMCGNPRRKLGERTMQERRRSAVSKHEANRGIYDGDTDTPCVWHCTDDDPSATCEAL